MSNGADCIIPANADVTGTGIRASIYGQVIFTILILLIVCADSKVTRQETVVLKELHRSLFWTYCAFIANGLVQIGLRALDPFHAVILLYLSWIIFIAIQPLRLVLAIHSNFESDVFSSIVWLFFLVAQPVLGLLVSLILWFPDDHQHQDTGWSRDCDHRVIANPFGTRTSLGGVAHDSRWILAFGSLFVLGFLFCVTTIALILIGKRRKARMLGWIGRHLTWIIKPLSSFYNPTRRFWLGLLLLVTVTLSIPMVFLVILTERMLVRNWDLLQPEERQWSFGQTLAIFMLGPPVLTTAEQAWKSWKENRDVVSTQGMPDGYLPVTSKELERPEPVVIDS